jgi:hypothetical protein
MTDESYKDVAVDDQGLALLLADMTDAVLRGEAVDLERVCGEHPEWSDELRRLWGAVMVADAAGSHIARQTAELPTGPKPS